MRLDEISTSVKDNLNFDIVDDIHVFMKNDPMFYRKEYYPTMCSIADKKKKAAPKELIKILMPLVNKAAKIYCKKFNLGIDDVELVNLSDRRTLVTKIKDEEMPRIGAGEYL